MPHPLTDRQLRAEFVSFFPDLKRTLQRNFRNLRPKARSEAVSEAIGLGFAMFLNARRNGRPATQWSIAHYTTLAVRDGRTLTSRQTDDALAPNGRNRHRRPDVLRLDHVNRQLLDDLLVDRRSREITYTAGFRIDWQEFVDQQPRRTRRVFDLLGQGYRRCDAARMLRISRPAIGQRMARAKRAWNEYWNGQPASVQAAS